MIPYGRQSIEEGDIKAVISALSSDWLTCGPLVDEFETQFADFVGAQHAVAVNSGTAALHLAMLVAGIGGGDRVLTSPNTFLASANCAAYVGATPDFCDIDPESYNLCPDAMIDSWRDDVRAVVAVDYAGQPCNMPVIAEFARARGAVVIEDACHAVGGSFKHDGRSWKIGGHPWADMTVCSFHPVKSMTTGEGGMLLTDNDYFASEARRLRSHGMTREPASFVGLGEGGALSERGPWYYEMHSLGYNFRIADLQCALGISQLKRLPQFLDRRRQIVRSYNEAFANEDFLVTPSVAPHVDRETSAWHLYTVKVDFAALGKSRSQVMSELRTMGVGSQVLYIPVYLQPWYQARYGYRPGKCPRAENFYAQALSLPLFPSMQESEVQLVVESVKSLAKCMVS